MLDEFYRTTNRGPIARAPCHGRGETGRKLMGKRKSSPRLSTTSTDVDESILSALGMFIHKHEIIIRFVKEETFYEQLVFNNKGQIWYDRQE